MWTRRNFGITIITLTAQSRREIVKSAVDFQCMRSLRTLRPTDQTRFLLRGFFGLLHYENDSTNILCTLIPMDTRNILEDLSFPNTNVGTANLPGDFDFKFQTWESLLGSLVRKMLSSWHFVFRYTFYSIHPFFLLLVLISFFRLPVHILPVYKSSMPFLCFYIPLFSKHKVL
jgi:hypothetical protein